MQVPSALQVLIWAFVAILGDHFRLVLQHIRYVHSPV